LIMKFPGCRRDVEINMWGVTSSRDELTGDFGDGREAISIGVCDLSCRLVGKVVACILGLLQQNRPSADMFTRSQAQAIGIVLVSSRQRCHFNRSHI
jgi:hypothetical protein